MRFILKALRNCAAAFLGIYLFNLVGVGFGLTLGLNVVNTIAIGLLGIPGFAALLLLRVMSQ